MESSRDILESARARYVEAKRAAENTISEHMMRSSRLLKQVRNVGEIHPESSAQSQMSYMRSLQSLGATMSDADMAVGPIPTYRRGTVSCSTSWSSSDSGRKQMTQAAWISQSSTVHSNLSKISNWEDPVKIPEILLTDPADILCGKKSATKDEDEAKDKLSELLNDTSYEIALEADVSDATRNTAMFSQHVASSLNYFKGDASSAGKLFGVTTNRELMDSLVSETCAGLEHLSHEWNVARGTGARLVEPQVVPVRAIRDSCDESTLSNIDDLYMKTFGMRSGLLGNDNNHTLTHALLHISEKDKSREAELAPKMCTTRPPVKAAAARKTSVSPAAKAGSSVTSISSESNGPVNPLDHVNILCEDKLAIRLHKMSDFNPPFTHMSGTSGTDVEVQADIVSMPKSEKSDPLNSGSKIKVVYAGRDDDLSVLGRGSLIIQPSSAELASESSASALVSNVKPRLSKEELLSPTPTVRTPEPQPADVRTRRALHREQLAKYEDEQHHRWREQHAPLYDKMRLNERCGVRMSMLCRGGRRGGSRLSHASRPVEAPTTVNAEDTSLIYESPSNKLQRTSSVKSVKEEVAPMLELGTCDSPRIVRGYYGYDDDPGLQLRTARSGKVRDFFATSSPRTMSIQLDKPVARSGFRDPFQDFDGWWNQHTVPLSRLREQLSIS
ncbi:uncharacterized protein BXIN_2946 [Babesia sp. Xinjiang]|uniref:uncharacterized protein n=1 Tax=Babesia sp. Xinjiang TaxID=462227 RepID=UPI000A24FD2D|nr:uncharacterized protein BXIN_2946 [Babesia sp. Xinjiang]ORM39534.1 hypothetical protein BXIN_2946 [Babesia sp. Xinjiang]